MGCRTNTELSKAAKNAAKAWMEDPSIKKYNLHNDTNAFKRLAEATVDKPYVPGAGHTIENYNQIARAAKKFGRDLRNAKTLTWPIIKHLYNGTSLSAKNPVVKNFYETLRRAEEFRNKHTQKMTFDYYNMMQELKMAFMEFDNPDITMEKIRNSSYQLRDFVDPSNLMYKRMANKKFAQLTVKEKKYRDNIINQLPAEKSMYLKHCLIYFDC